MANPGERATERVAVFMTPTEKAAYTNQAHSLGLSLGQFFREAGAAYAHRSTNHPGTTQRSAEADIRALAEAEALEAALNQLELSTSRIEQTLDVALVEVRTALRMNDKVEAMAGSDEPHITTAASLVGG